MRLCRSWRFLPWFLSPSGVEFFSEQEDPRARAFVSPARCEDCGGVVSRARVGARVFPGPYGSVDGKQ